jgi:hypothetical protein
VDTIALRYNQLTQLGFPARFPLVQFPNLPLILGFVLGTASRFVTGVDHNYLRAASYLAMTVWAYEELAHGTNWFRRVLGLAYIGILLTRVARAFRG